jgi:transposase-like protein
MPWEKTSGMDQRVKFIAECLSPQYSKSELCRAYGISRPTADKWIKRYEETKAKGFEELSRAPHHHPNQTSEEVREMIVAGITVTQKKRKPCPAGTDRSLSKGNY